MKIRKNLKYLKSKFIFFNLNPIKRRVIKRVNKIYKNINIILILTMLIV